MGEKEARYARTGANYRGRRISVNSRAVLRGGGSKERKEDGEKERETQLLLKYLRYQFRRGV